MLKYLSYLLLVSITSISFSAQASDKFGLGREALSEEISAWDIDVLPDGRGLPKGKGNAIDGEEVFAAKCAVCHGDFGEGVDNWPVIAGGFDTLADKDPVKTVGSYWPYLSTVWDYINRSMPFGAAQTLTADEVYAITAYILYSNDMVDDDFELSNENFTEVKMHNTDGFIIDDRETTEYKLWRTKPCMKNCKKDVKITMRASVVDVTPEEDKADKKAKENPASAAATPKLSYDKELAAQGKKTFAVCGACHKVGEGAKNGLGPQLYKVLGRTIGGVSDFKYSASFQKAAEQGLVWNEKNMQEFLNDPNKFMPKTKMLYPGIKDETALKAVIEYMKSINE